MADTDFSQFNPPATNIETDATFQSDSTRTGGITFDQIMSSVLANKILYQASTMNRSLALMLVNKGYSPKDGTSPYQADSSSNAAVTALSAVLANILTKADVPQVANRTAVVITNPAITTQGITAAVPTGLMSDTQVIRVKGGVRCTASPGASTQVFIGVGATTATAGLSPAPALVQSGDFLEFEINIGAETYIFMRGVSNALPVSQSGKQAAITGMASGLAVAINVSGIGSGTFSTDYISVEAVPA
jgi:hypothetical protein